MKMYCHDKVLSALKTDRLVEAGFGQVASGEKRLKYRVVHYLKESVGRHCYDFTFIQQCGRYLDLLINKAAVSER